MIDIAIFSIIVYLRKQYVDSSLCVLTSSTVCAERQTLNVVTLQQSGWLVNSNPASISRNVDMLQELWAVCWR